MKEQKAQQRLRILLLILAAFVGAGAGVISTVLTSKSIDNYAASLLDDRRFTALAPTKAPTLPGTYEESLKSLRENGWRSLAAFTLTTKDSAIPSQWITSQDERGYGVVVSSDGWVLTTTAFFPNGTALTTYDVWVEKRRYALEKIVRDSGSALVLLKLKDASQLLAVGFGSAGDVQSGALLFALDGERALNPLTVRAADAETAFGPQKAETFTTSWLLDEAFEAGYPLFSSSGGLLGFSTGENKAFPLHHSRGFVQDVVRTGAERTPGLGVYVADLSRVYNVSDELRQGRVIGALVIPPTPSSSALLKGGPADKAGMLVRDIILDVDGEVITAQKSLAEILSEYEPGEIANMRVLRNGQTLDLAVTLADLKDLVY